MAKKSYGKKYNRKGKNLYSRGKKLGYVTKGFPSKPKRRVYHSNLTKDLPRSYGKELKHFTLAAKESWNETTNTAGTQYDIDMTNNTKWHIMCLLSGSAEGVKPGHGPEQRVGQKIFMKQLQLALKIGWPGSGDPDVDTYPMGTTKARLIILIDKQPNQALLDNGRDVLLESAVAGVGGAMQQYNTTNWKRFKILYDQCRTIKPSEPYTYDNTGDQPGFQGSFTDWDVKIPLKETVQYSTSDTSGTPASIVTNNLYAIAFIDPIGQQTGGITANQFTGETIMTSRVWYTD